MGKKITGQVLELLDWRWRETVPLYQFMEAAKMSHFLIFFLPLLVKQDWFSQTCQDLWYMYRDYFSNHFWKADLRGEWLSLDKKVKCKLVELLHGLKYTKKKKLFHHENIRYTELMLFPKTEGMVKEKWGLESSDSQLTRPLGFLPSY